MFLRGLLLGPAKRVCRKCQKKNLYKNARHYWTWHKKLNQPKTVRILAFNFACFSFPSILRVFKDYFCKQYRSFLKGWGRKRWFSSLWQICFYVSYFFLSFYWFGNISFCIKADVKCLNKSAKNELTKNRTLQSLMPHHDLSQLFCMQLTQPFMLCISFFLIKRDNFFTKINQDFCFLQMQSIL